MHYSIQITLSDLEDKCLEMFDGVSWVKQWDVIGGGKYVGQYPSGQAVISGPMVIGNPNKPWFEIQCTDDAILAELGANEVSTMKSHMRTNALLRAFYRVSGRKMIRNSAGNPVGPLPDFVICGTSPKSSYLDDEDPEEAQELLDLD